LGKPAPQRRIFIWDFFGGAKLIWNFFMKPISQLLLFDV